MVVVLSDQLHSSERVPPAPVLIQVRQAPSRVRREMNARLSHVLATTELLRSTNITAHTSAGSDLATPIHTVL